MKYYFLLSYYLIFPLLSFSQNKKPTDIGKWNNAVINLEMVKENTSNFETIDLRAKYLDSLSKGTLSFQRYNFLSDSLSGIRKFTGTAIFFSNKKKRYLITARHVIFDPEEYKLAFEKGLINNINEKQYLNNVYQKIIRIPLNGDTTSFTDPLIFLLSTKGSYILSSQEEDLAIIDLSSFKRFADFLELKGLKPITFKDIDTSGLLGYGQEINVFGFPYFSNTNKSEISIMESHWQSNSRFVNSVTYGKVSSISYQNYYFIGDASIAPGNSGGAVVSHNKLVGVVSAQPSYYISDMQNNTLPYVSRMPYTIAVKASFIPELLRKLDSMPQF